MQDTTPLSDAQWQALAGYERGYYGHGTHAYTDVMPQEESGGLVRTLWNHTAECVQMHEETDDEPTDEIAARVAHALATMAFGVTFATDGLIAP